MISSVTVRDCEATAVKHFCKVPALRGTFDFTPGLNVLVGPNGSGKSTLLQAIGRMFCVTRTGVPLFNSGWSALYTRSSGWAPLVMLSGLEIQHDGQAPIFLDSFAPPGTFGGPVDMNHERSSGERNIARLRDYLSWYEEGEHATLRSVAPSHSFERQAELWGKFIEPRIPRGKQTLLLDEPDRSLDLIQQEEMWSHLRELSKRYQIITSSHSPFSLHDSDVLELVPGHRDAVLDVVARLQGSIRGKGTVLESSRYTVFTPNGSMDSETTG